MKRDKWEDYTATFKPMFHWQGGDAREAYSYDKPSTCFWNGFVNGLVSAGYSEAAAKEWVCSKASRWMFDGEMAEKVERLAYEFARKNSEQYADRDNCEQWAKESAKRKAA